MHILITFLQAIFASLSIFVTDIHSVTLLMADTDISADIANIQSNYLVQHYCKVT